MLFVINNLNSILAYLGWHLYVGFNIACILNWIKRNVGLKRCGKSCGLRWLRTIVLCGSQYLIYGVVFAKVIYSRMQKDTYISDSRQRIVSSHLMLAMNLPLIYGSRISGDADSSSTYLENQDIYYIRPRLVHSRCQVS